MKSEINLRSKIKDIKEMISTINEEEVPAKLTRVASCKYVCQRETMRSPIIIEKSSNKRSTSKVNKTESIMTVPSLGVSSPRFTRTTKATIEKF